MTHDLSRLRSGRPVRRGAGRPVRRGSAHLPAIIVLAVLLTLLITARGSVALAYSYYPPFPCGDIGLSRPVIGQRLVLPPQEAFEGGEMWLDGGRVPAVWNSETGLFSYVPPGPLAAGLHHVRISIRVSGPGYTYQPLVTECRFRVSSGAVDALPAPGPEDLHVRAFLNHHRREAGLTAVTWAPALDLAAEHHAAYLTATPGGDEAGDRHRETPGRPFFTGVTAGERAAYFGFYNSVWEVIAFEGSPEAAIRGWLATPYHRLSLLDPHNTEFGCGFVAAPHGLEVVKMGGGFGRPPGGAVVWPPDGATEVETSWPGLESPDPLRLYPGTTGPVGYTISLTFTPEPISLSLTSAALVGSDAGVVPCMVFSPENDAHLGRHTIALIPFHPLEALTTYTATVEVLVDEGAGLVPFHRTWSFTTGPGELEVGPVIRCVSRILGEKVTIDFTGLKVRPGLSVYLDGLPVRDLLVRSRTSISFSVPTGLVGPAASLLLVTTDGQEYSPGRLSGLPSSPGPAFSATTALLPGAGGSVPAYRHAGGTTLVPDTVLTAMGATAVEVPSAGRTFWTLGRATGLVSFRSPLAYVDGHLVRLALPAQEIDGRRLVPIDFVLRLSSSTGFFLDLIDHWARDDIARLAERGVVSGMGDGTFGPEATLTRAQFIKMVVMARGLPLQPGESGGFGDVSGHWAGLQGYLAPAREAGIIVAAEYPDGLFRPDREITREEMAVAIIRALGDLRAEAEGEAWPAVFSGPAVIAGRLYHDAAAWRRPGYVAVAIENGIVAGYPEADGSYAFRPEGLAKRAEAAVMILRMLDYTERSDGR